MNSEQLKQLFEKEVYLFKGWFANFSNLKCQERWELWQYYAEWLQEREIQSSISDEEIETMSKKAFPSSHNDRRMWKNGFRACLKHLKEQ